jgi:7-keto-8-aminopelargonate synthetase-like enzyme
MKNRQGVKARVAGRTALRTTLDSRTLPAPCCSCGGRTIVSFRINSYLGLAFGPHWSEATRLGLRHYGVGNCESRLPSEHPRVYCDLEAKLALRQALAATA